MNRTEFRHALIGGLVLIIAALFFINAYSGKKPAGTAADGYQVTAIFGRVDGLGKGAEVRLGGIRIGEVANMSLTDNMRARVDMDIFSDVLIPADSSAVILSNGLAGAKFIELDPGGEDRMLSNGDRLVHTQGAIIVEELMELIIGQIKARQAAQAQ
jgi:phospholipid/cholesterol/gamma-HCH transport system substrate-binding protein